MRCCRRRSAAPFHGRARTACPAAPAAAPHPPAPHMHGVYSYTAHQADAHSPQDRSKMASHMQSAGQGSTQRRRGRMYTVQRSPRRGDAYLCGVLMGMNTVLTWVLVLVLCAPSTATATTSSATATRLDLRHLVVERAHDEGHEPRLVVHALAQRQQPVADARQELTAYLHACSACMRACMPGGQRRATQRRAGQGRAYRKGRVCSAGCAGRVCRQGVQACMHACMDCTQRPGRLAPPKVVAAKRAGHGPGSCGSRTNH